MGKFIDLTGQRFGRLTVIQRSGSGSGGSAMWRCLCDCGTEVVVIGQSLRQGLTRSCGCYSRDQTRKREYTHGMTGTRLYRIWDGMIDRCYRKSNRYYHNYGGRGITVCDEWRNDFSSFMKWSLSNGYQECLTIERKDNSKGYFPDNCEWISLKEQQYNKRDNHLITYNGVTRTVTEWAEITGINRNTLFARVNRLKWSPEKAIETPAKKYRTRGS